MHDQLVSHYRKSQTDFGYLLLACGGPSDTQKGNPPAPKDTNYAVITGLFLLWQPRRVQTVVISYCQQEHCSAGMFI